MKSRLVDINDTCDFVLFPVEVSFKDIAVVWAVQTALHFKVRKPESKRLKKKLIVFIVWTDRSTEHKTQRYFPCKPVSKPNLRQ